MAAPPLAGQMISGAALLVLLVLHIVAQHLVVPTDLRYTDDGMSGLRSPLMLGMEVAVLAFVAYHALVGIRVVLFDIGFSIRTEQRSGASCGSRGSGLSSTGSPSSRRSSTPACDWPTMEALVGIVIVSHSAQIAAGTVKLARQMAGDELRIEAAGGTADGGSGPTPRRS